MRALLIGYGNPLRSDDGLGWRVAEALRTQVEQQAATEATAQAQSLDIVTCQQLNPELAEAISRADLAIFVDAAVPTGVVESVGSGTVFLKTKDQAVSLATTRPGTIIERDLEPTCESPQCFSHELTASTLLACAGELFGSCPKGKLFSVVGEDFGMGETLSAPVLAAVAEVVRRIEALVALKDPTRTRETQSSR